MNTFPNTNDGPYVSSPFAKQLRPGPNIIELLSVRNWAKVLNTLHILLLNEIKPTVRRIEVCIFLIV